MKRYFIVNEFFGSRVYDSIEKNELYFDKENTDKVKKILKNNYVEIHNSGSNLSAPLKISMNITKKCNLRCSQCFSDSGEIVDVELSTGEICMLFDEMQKNGTFFICIGGGEPLMRKDLLVLLNYGKRKQLAISLVSNGLLLTRELIGELNKRDLDTIWISLEGLESNHERLRGKGTFKKAINALQLLQKEYASRKAIRVSLNRYNIDEYKGLIKLAENLSIDVIRFTPLLSFGRAKNEKLTISQDDYIYFLKEIEKVESSVKIIHPNIIDSKKFWVNSNDFGCHCGKETVWIDELGNFSPCIFFGKSFSLGNIKNDSYLKIWKKSLSITNVKGNDICKKCDNYSICRGGCRARVLDQFGNLDGIDPLCPLKKNFTTK